MTAYINRASLEACTADHFRLGQWTIESSERNKTQSCRTHTYSNITCLEDVTLLHLCKALDYRSALLVGDSIMLALWTVVPLFVKKPATQIGPCATGEGKCYGVCCRVWILPCANGTQPIKLTFARHNHLIGRHMYKPVDSRVDDSWRDPRTLDRHPWLILSTGAHLTEVPDHNRSGTFELRAAELASFLNKTHPHRLIYVKPQWGVDPFYEDVHGPTAPVLPNITFRWDLLPAIGTAYSKALEAMGAVTVDPTLALAQRSDCRADFLHSAAEVYAQSTWRLVQAAAALLTMRLSDRV